ncbi:MULTISPECIES: hypothetical protein [unclassified Methylobacterium]|uniref:hypothetical protein n=1 Tax=unclassified Methylobacterium TaxID=2615210 RepID=UPI000365FADB|nr:MULTISPECIES: hypothetical protein [Methylobacterium]WFT80831.1 hypothetical protein QA634_02710 [Methylobacterium nodulans]
MNQAISGYLADTKPGPRVIADGVMLDIDAAVLSHGWAHLVAHDRRATEPARRSAIRTALLLAALG